MAIVMSDYIIPLLAAKRSSTSKFDLDRYAGSAFFINSGGWIVTCSHIVNALENDEALIAKHLGDNKFYEIQNIRCHPLVDFAIGKTNLANTKFLTPFKNEILHAKIYLLVGSLRRVNKTKI